MTTNKLDIADKALIIDLIIKASQKVDDHFSKLEYLALIEKVKQL